MAGSTPGQGISKSPSPKAMKTVKGLIYLKYRKKLLITLLMHARKESLLSIPVRVIALLRRPVMLFGALQA